MSKHIFECIDAHTCGNPVRLILTEKPDLEGISMSEKRLDFLKKREFRKEFHLSYCCWNIDYYQTLFVSLVSLIYLL